MNNGNIHICRLFLGGPLLLLRVILYPFASNLVSNLEVREYAQKTRGQG
jgi:hypothetical protein